MLIFRKKIADISKIKRALVLNERCSETIYVYMCVYLRTKFQVSSTVLRSFRKGGNPPTPRAPPSHFKTNPKSPPNLGVKRNSVKILEDAKGFIFQKVLRELMKYGLL